MRRKLQFGRIPACQWKSSQQKTRRVKHPIVCVLCLHCDINSTRMVKLNVVVLQYLACATFYLSVWAVLWQQIIIAFNPLLLTCYPYLNTQFFLNTFNTFIITIGLLLVAIKMLVRCLCVKWHWYKVSCYSFSNLPLAVFFTPSLVSPTSVHVSDICACLSLQYIQIFIHVWHVSMLW